MQQPEESIQTSHTLSYVIVSSNEFIKYAKILIYSILRNTRDSKVHWVIYGNRKPKEVVFEDLRLQIEILNKPEGKSEEELRTFYATSRARHILEALERKRSVIFLDADSLVRKIDADSISEKREIMAFHRDLEVDPRNKFLISSIFFPYSIKSVEFVSLWQSKVEPFKFGPWYSCQRTFYEVSLERDWGIGRLPEEWSDIHQSLNSNIWSGKGGMKFNNNWRHRYTREFDIYRISLFIENVFRRLKIEIELNPSRYVYFIHPPIESILTIARFFKRKMLGQNY